MNQEEAEEQRQLRAVFRQHAPARLPQLWRVWQAVCGIGVLVALAAWLVLRLWEALARS